MNPDFDIAVIGGGPAGTTAAAILAANGRKVAIFEHRVFPRQKVCGEFVSIGARPVLRQLGVLAKFDAVAGPEIRRMAALPQNGRILECTLPADAHGCHARALCRARFDNLLMQNAKSSGVTVFQPAHVDRIEPVATGGFSIFSRQCGEISAGKVIMADGKAHSSLALPAVDKIKTAASGHELLNTSYLGYKAHFRDCDMPDDLTVIAGGPEIYAGLLRTSDLCHDTNEQIAGNRGKAEAPTYNMAFAVRQIQAAEHSGPDDLLAYLFKFNPGLKRIMRRAKRESAWFACGPMRPGVRRLYANGLFYSGNAAGEVHALVGEGMTLALRSGRLLAGEFLAGMAAGKGDAEIAKNYQSAWRTEFTGRLDAGNLFSNLLMRPMAGNIAADAFNCFPELLHAAVRFSGKAASRQAG